MNEPFSTYLNDIESFGLHTSEELEKFRLKYLVKKGILTSLFGEIKNIAPADRKAFGESVNLLKTKAEDRYNQAKTQIEEALLLQDIESPDMTFPPAEYPIGSRHPISITRERIIEVFSKIGFNVSYGPEIEDDWHNFTALNMDENHPARDMQDTFFLQMNPQVLLRTHTSNVQIRVMENSSPPIRTLSPGRTYRNEAISARAHCMFHQVEGLYVDEDVSFADLKQSIYFFVKEMFGEATKMRLRASYFPFTEPSAEVDISCLICKGTGCAVCKNTGWVEIMGCGMVDPAVLTNCNIDAEKYSGFAFGMGIERIAMLLFGIKDLRLFTQNDIRFLKEFSTVM